MLCDDCIHNEVCGEEGHLDKALTFCANHRGYSHTARWNYYADCSNCHHRTVSDSDLIAQGYKFCPYCGAYMVGSEPTIQYL